MEENINNLVDTKEVNLYSEYLPGGILPHWIDISSAVSALLFIVFGLGSYVAYVIYRARYNKKRGLDTKEVYRRIVGADEDDDGSDLSDKDLKVNYTMRRAVGIIVASLAVIYCLTSLGSMVNNFDKQKIYRGIESTTSASLEGAKIKGDMSDSNVFQLNDGTLMKYDLEHKQGSTYTLKVYTEGRM